MRAQTTTASPGPRAEDGAFAPPVRHAFLDARDPAAWQRVGGIPLVTRWVRTLELEGVTTIALLTDRPRSAATLGCRSPQTQLLPLPAPAKDAPAGARVSAGAGTSPLPPDWRGPVLVADARVVADRRIVRALLRATAPTRVVGVHDAPEHERLRLALLDAGRAGLLGAPAGALPDARRLDPASLPTWSQEMRGDMPIFLDFVPDETRAREVGWRLVEATQKHVMDAPARWLDPHVENRLLHWLAPTRVTPNQVTLACLPLGFLAAWLLLHGVFALALPLMYLVGWLDGVDGKLARLRLHYSRLGAGEAYFDFAIENAWWIALSAWLAGEGHGSAAWWWGAALVLGNLLDEIAYTLSQAWLGTSLDLLTPADAAFRLVAGRRNVFVAMLLVAVLLGSPWGGLVAMGAWAAVTGVAHAVRLWFALQERSRERARA